MNFLIWLKQFLTQMKLLLFNHPKFPLSLFVSWSWFCQFICNLQVQPTSATYSPAHVCLLQGICCYISFLESFLSDEMLSNYSNYLSMSLSAYRSMLLIICNFFSLKHPNMLFVIIWLFYFWKAFLMMKCHFFFFILNPLK